MTPSPALRQHGSRRFPEATLESHDPCSGESALDGFLGTFRAGFVHWKLMRCHHIRPKGKAPYGISSQQSTPTVKSRNDRCKQSVHYVHVYRISNLLVAVAPLSKQNKVIWEALESQGLANRRAS